MAITLKAARVNNDFTQKTAAEAFKEYDASITENVISNWERGISFPDATQIPYIEKVYKVSYNDIIFLPKRYR